MRTVLLALSMLLLLASAALAKDVSIATEEWPPYSTMENGKPTGFCTEVIAAVLAKMGDSPSIKAYPWARAEAMALAGETDALYSASKKAAREEACYYPAEPLFDSKYVFFIRAEDKDKLAFNTFDDLKGKKVGVTASYAYNDDLWNFLKAEKNFEEATTDETNFQKLLAKRIDYFPAELGNGLALIKKLGATDKISYIAKPIIQKPYFIIFSKKKVDAQYVEKFSSELKAYKGSPEFKALHKRYLE